jgi:hypothetical protein
MKQWRQFSEWIERSRKHEYESLIPEPFPPLQVYRGGSRPTRLLYFTKDFLCTHWMLRGEFPKHWIALVRYGLPTRSYLEEVRRRSEELSLPIFFVGDLDPLDLTVYLMLRRGDVMLSSRSRPALPVHYFGVSDRWLEMRPSSKRELRGSLGMERFEREHLDFLLGVLPNLRELVGDRCFELLTAGFKLELEGACNASVAGKQFPSRLLAYLDRRPPRVASTVPTGRSSKGRRRAAGQREELR